MTHNKNNKSSIKLLSLVVTCFIGLLLMLICSSCYPSNAVVMTYTPRPTNTTKPTHTPEPTKDYFATEMGVTVEEFLDYILEEELSDSEMEQKIREFILTTIQKPEYDKSRNALYKYIDDIEVVVQEGHIYFGVYAHMETEKDFSRIFEELFFSGLVQTTNSQGEFIWGVEEIGVVYFESSAGSDEYLKLFLDKEDIFNFVNHPDANIYDYMRVYDNTQP